MDTRMIIEELLFDNAVALNCSRSTAYRTKKEINNILERENYSWRVKLVIDNTERFPYSLVTVTKGE